MPKEGRFAEIARPPERQAASKRFVGFSVAQRWAKGFPISLNPARYEHRAVLVIGVSTPVENIRTYGISLAPGADGA